MTSSHVNPFRSTRPRPNFARTPERQHRQKNQPMLKTIIRVTAFMALIACPVTAQQTRIQSPAEFLGYPLGERFTDHAGVVRYMEALAVASPIVRVRRY